MDRQKTILLAFAGQPIEQTETIRGIGDGYECWDLKKLTRDEFVDTLQKKIPPVNDNVLRNYKAGEDNNDMFGITEKQYRECSWALLIPDGLDDALGNSYSETLFLLNLYSPVFLYPLFSASNLGIMRQSHGKRVFEFAHYQNQSQIFKTDNFVTFFKMMLPQSQYGIWQADRAQKWDKEDWRLFVAAMLFSGLKDYDNSKTSFGWQRESTKMATILECLFTAGDIQREEVGYRLRKRVAALLSNRIPTIEAEIKKLYAQRSDFVHGSFFAQIARETGLPDNELPIPDFKMLYRQKEYVRWALVAYLRLAQLIKSRPGVYGNERTVIAVLEQSIIDTELREQMLEGAETALALMPESQTFNTA